MNYTSEEVLVSSTSTYQPPSKQECIGKIAGYLLYYQQLNWWQRLFDPSLKKALRWAEKYHYNYPHDQTK
jgi:hypothetical protein